mmetsp:Transcript_1179/g.2811  ORF Transcript_1179/g.2811 Transcript_1179/m.2811 type:complete len:92 (-) Transcript_1179:11-286(-)
MSKKAMIVLFVCGHIPDLMGSEINSRGIPVTCFHALGLLFTAAFLQMQCSDDPSYVPHSQFQDFPVKPPKSGLENCFCAASCKPVAQLRLC